MADEKRDPTDESIPPIDFTTFMLSMSTACMAHLGEVTGPDGGSPDGGSVVDLAMARQTIEILELLEAKTRGNLTGEEERILTQVLGDLRDAYDRASRG
jgi:hypothetical protein